MIIPWIKIATNIAMDPKVHRIAKACGVNDAEALGLVVAVLTAMPMLAEDGNLSEVSDAKLEAAALWERKRGVFASAFRQHWCEKQVVTNWERWNGSTLREFAADRRRKKEQREQQKSGGSSDGSSPESAADGLTLRRKKEETENYVPTTQTEADIPSAPAEVLPWVHSSGHEALAALFTKVPDRRIWIGYFRGWASGLDMDQQRPCEPERLAVAVRDFVARGKHLEPGGPAPDLLRGFVKRAKAPAIRAAGQLTELEYKAEQLRTLRDQNERRRRTKQPEKPEPHWAAEIDAAFPDGRTFSTGSAA